jgi:hypothetical protein
MLMDEVSATVTKNYHRHLDRSATDAQVGVSDLQVIPWAAAEITTKQFPAYCCVI